MPQFCLSTAKINRDSTLIRGAVPLEHHELYTGTALAGMARYSKPLPSEAALSHLLLPAQPEIWGRPAYAICYSIRTHRCRHGYCRRGASPRRRAQRARVCRSATSVPADTGCPHGQRRPEAGLLQKISRPPVRAKGTNTSSPPARKHPPSRHCEERSDMAIHGLGVAGTRWIAAPFGLAMTGGGGLVMTGMGNAARSSNTVIARSAATWQSMDSE